MRIPTLCGRASPSGNLLLAAMGVAALGLVRPAELRAQGTAQSATPQFDVASVRLAPTQDVFETRPKRTTGRFRWTTQLAYLLGYAYQVEWWRISGNPPGFGSIYQIEATHDSAATEDQVRLMVQSLLIDRFKMVFRRVPKEVEGYALSVAKGGPKLQDAKEGELPAVPEWMRRPSAGATDLEGWVIATMPAPGVGAITGRRVTMLQLTETLQRLLRTAVLDRTGLSGKYYFGIRYATEADPDVPYPNLFGAVADLGLKLEKHKGPVEMLVVDRIERIPTEN
jgi:uncharacterized protein (TIGR03435 family)